MQSRPATGKTEKSVTVGCLFLLVLMLVFMLIEVLVYRGDARCTGVTRAR
jgi:hypothetical protein